MTDFVIQEWEKDLYTDDFAKIVKNYADFLKQPLKLEMFTCIVPEAKDKVLFENYSVIKKKTYSVVIDSHGRNVWLSWNQSKTVESLINEVTEVSLTKNAIEHIFG